jgi:hypothetical protein
MDYNNVRTFGPLSPGDLKEAADSARVHVKELTNFQQM